MRTKATMNIPPQDLSKEEIVSSNALVNETPSTEKCASTPEMFVNGVKNGRAASPRTLENAVESKEAPKAEIQDIHQTEPTNEQIHRITQSQCRLLKSVLDNKDNHAQLIRLKTSTLEQRVDFLLDIDAKIGVLNLTQNEKLLLEFLLNAYTIVCIEAWPKRYAQLILDDHRDVLIKGVVLNDLYTQIRAALAEYNELCPQYIEMIKDPKKVLEYVNRLHAWF